MKKNSIFAILLLLMAGLQAAWGQGFRVYKSDGTVAQFSLRTDSIVFYDGIGTDQDFGPFTPVNQCIVGTWYKSKSESMTFNENGTTDYADGATYKFLPYQGTIIIYNAGGSPMNILKVHDVVDGTLVVSTLGSESFSVWNSTPPVQFVTKITLNKTSLTLQPNGIETLTATVYPSDADNKEVEWSSSDETIAEINSDGDGRVKGNALGSCVITCIATDGSGVKAECQVTVESPDPGNHAWVDLGLPSGTLWATCNIGAKNPQDYGDYFAWGETEGYKSGKRSFLWSTYKYCEGSDHTMIKYCTQSSFGYNGFTDNLTELLPEDDAATANWGNAWQMPSLAQYVELINSSYTTTVWTTVSGIKGRKITSKSNGNSIFLPATGYRGGTSLYEVGIVGSYWSRTLAEITPNGARSLNFESDIITTGGHDYRFDALGVRPVRVQYK